MHCDSFKKIRFYIAGISFIIIFIFIDDSTFLNYKKGDLILIIKDEEYSSNHGWIKGKNERTGQTGAVSTDAVLVLPSLKKPTNEVLV